MGFGDVQLFSPLGPTSWAILAGIPVGIIALYFLKLRRRPVQVPSTLLWRRSLEDLHVNSLFQRLRKNLLLFLQLAAVLLILLALAGLRIRGASTQGERYVLAIDNSASMSATDVLPTRLEKAKLAAKQIVDSMKASDLAMVVTFSDRARVVSNYTGNRSLLTQRIDSIAPDRGDHLPPRGLAGRRRPGQPLEAGRGRGGQQPRAAQAEDLHRRRVPRRRGVQPGQPRARGRRHRRGPPPAPSADADSKARAEARTKPPLEQRGHPGLADPPQRGEARRLSGLRPGPQLQARGRRHRGQAVQARPQESRRRRHPGRRDLPEDRQARRPVVQLRPPRRRRRRVGSAPRIPRRPAAGQPRLHPHRRPPARRRSWPSPPATVISSTPSGPRWRPTAPT